MVLKDVWGECNTQYRVCYSVRLHLAVVWCIFFVLYNVVMVNTRGNCKLQLVGT